MSRVGRVSSVGRVSRVSRMSRVRILSVAAFRLTRLPSFPGASRLKAPMASSMPAVHTQCSAVQMAARVQGSRGRPSGLLRRVPRWAAERAPSPLQAACDRPVLGRQCRPWARCVQPEGGAVGAQLVELVVVGAEHAHVVAPSGLGKLPLGLGLRFGLRLQLSHRLGGSKTVVVVSSRW